MGWTIAAVGLNMMIASRIFRCVEFPDKGGLNPAQKKMLFDFGALGTVLVGAILILYGI